MHQPFWKNVVDANICMTIDLNVSGQTFITPKDMAAMNLALISELKEAEKQDLLVIYISNETQNFFVPQVIFTLL